MADHIESAIPPESLKPNPENLQKIMADWDFTVVDFLSAHSQLFSRVTTCATKILQRSTYDLGLKLIKPINRVETTKMVQITVP